MFSTVISIVAIALSLVALSICIFAYALCRKTAAWVVQNNKSSVTLHKLTELETEMTLLHDSIEGLQTALRKLRGRMQARKNNEKDRGAETDEEWKARTNAALIGGNVNGGQSPT